MRHNRLFEKKIHKDKYDSFIFDRGRRREVYLVGGYLRDLIRGIDSHDRDYIVRGNVLSFVRTIRKRTGGTIIEFKFKDTVRLALKTGHTLDFSHLEGTLEENLSQRDFTMNALAWSPGKGVIDLYNGINDIHRRVVRSISEKNLIDDPLRMLRAYRFSAEIDGTIDPATRRIIKQNHMMIHFSSDERITLEMFNLLNAKQSSTHLKMALADQLLNTILPFKFNQLSYSLKALVTFEKTILHLLPSYIKVLLYETFAQNLSYKGLLCLHILLGDCFEGNSLYNVTISRKILNRLEVVNKGIKELKRMKKFNNDKIFRIFKNSGEASIDILIVTNRLPLLKEFRRFQKIWRNGLLSAEEVMNIAGVSPGAELGKILVSLKKAKFEGILRSRKEAVSFIKQVGY